METDQSVKLTLNTADLDEAIAAVSGIYCPHEIGILGSRDKVRAQLSTMGHRHHRIVNLRYSVPVQVDAGNFDNLILMMTCTDGSGQALQDDRRVEWHRGQTLPLSPNLSSKFRFDCDFKQQTLRLDVNWVEKLCARLLGHALDRPLRLDLRPFSQQLEAAWRGAVQLLMMYDELGVPLPPAAMLHFEEYISTLILEMHPHNYTNALQEPATAHESRLVKEAEHIMRHQQPETVSGVAELLGVSLRTLESSFREFRQSTPSLFLRQVRLEAARAELLSPTEATSVTSAALENGFMHLARFSAYYRSAFDEYPSQTLARSKKKNPSHSSRRSFEH